MVTIRPTKDHVVIKRTAPETVSKGGVLIPDNALEKPKIGRVVWVNLESTGLEVGQEVIFNQWSGVTITHDGEDYLIMKESDVIAIIEQDKQLKVA